MTELLWDGKYGADGQRTQPFRDALPLQTVEMAGELGRRPPARDLLRREGEAAWRNRLIWGDKRYVLPALLPEFAGTVDLIYIDPPFDTGAGFSLTGHLPGGSSTRTRARGSHGPIAYRDAWGRGLDGYLQWFYETVVLLYELLSPTGSIYVHLDHRLDHVARCVLDEIFGPDCFRNVIAWRRDVPGKGAKRVSRQWPRNADSILYYSRASNVWTFKQQYVALNDEQKKAYRYTDGDGRRYKAVQLGDYSAASIARLDAEGLIHTSGSGARYKKYYLDDASATLDCLWTDLPGFGTRTAAREHTGYPTQKPEALLRRIIEASSNKGDLVLDCFCGSGTTAAVAEKLGRRWIACDLGRFAVQTTRKRLLAIDNVRPFVAQDLGTHDRQAWQVAEFQGRSGDARGRLEAGAPSETGRQAAYRRFVLDLYGAEALEGYAWLHGLKNGRFVHVGPVDAPITEQDVAAIARECRKTAGSARACPLGAPASSRHTLAGDTLAAASTVPTEADRSARPVRADDVGSDRGRLEAGAPSRYGEGWQDAGAFKGAGPEDATKSVDVLGWDFAFEVNETARAIAAEANVRLAFKRIPREVLEKKAVEQGGVRFFELAALSLDITQKGRAVTLALRDFVIPPDDVPAEVQRAIGHWSQWIDYWAVDWDYREDTFHNQWQSYRTKKDLTLHCRVTHTYDEPGSYAVVVKVIDILGNETTRRIMVQAP